MRILFLGGGSVGHLAPLVAAWRELQKMDGTAEALFACSQRSEDGEYLRSEGVPYRTLPSPQRTITLPRRFFSAVRASKALMKEYEPQVIFSKGGAVSIAPCLIASRRKIPIVLHDSDAVMGRANRLLSKWATTVCLGFPPEDARHLPSYVFTGNPIRPEILKGSRAEGQRITGFAGKKPVLLVLGGSQGAAALNAWIARVLPSLLAHWDIAHITGKGKAGAQTQKGYWSIPFAHKELAHLYAVADLAVSRAGAGMISELAACGIPAVLVPLKGLAQDHQTANAKRASQTGGFLHVPQTQLEELPQKLATLQNSPSLLKDMGQKAHALDVPNAARQIAKIIVQSLDGGQSDA